MIFCRVVNHIKNSLKVMYRLAGLPEVCAAGAGCAYGDRSRTDGSFAG